ncbi:unnamed protein product, partial [Staurois parvus]
MPAARSRSLSWVPVRPPIAAGLHRHTLPCATFRSPHHCWCVPFFAHRVLADYGPPIGCCQAPNLPWAPYTASSCCCQVQSLFSWSLYGLPLLLSPSPHSAMCHFQVSITLLVCSIF